MTNLLWDSMQVLDLYDEAYLRHDERVRYIWDSLFEAPCNFLVYMTKLTWDSMQVLHIYDQGNLRHDASCL